VVNLINFHVEYLFLFLLVQKYKNASKKCQSYNQKQSGTFFMVHGVYLTPGLIFRYATERCFLFVIMLSY